jgi:hypothetical protein
MLILKKSSKRFSLQFITLKEMMRCLRPQKASNIGSLRNEFFITAKKNDNNNSNTCDNNVNIEDIT